MKNGRDSFLRGHETHPARPLTPPLSITPWKFNSSPPEKWMAKEDDPVSYLGPGNFFRGELWNFGRAQRKNISAEPATRHFRCGSLFHFLRGWYAQGGLVRWFTGYGCYGCKNHVFFSKWRKNRWIWWKMWKLFLVYLEVWEKNWKTTLTRKKHLATMDFQGLYLQPLVVGSIVKHSQLRNRLSEQIPDAPCMEYTSLHLP